MRAHPARTLALAAILAAALGAAGCGSDDGGGSSGQPASAGGGSGGSGGSLAVTETEFKIAPAAPKISKTGSVTFTVANKGKFPHALAVEGQGVESRTATLQPGETATLNVPLKKNGTYEWYCPVDGHRQKGMEGKLTVGSGGSSGGGNAGSSGGY
jgi:plastocyanin